MTEYEEVCQKVKAAAVDLALEVTLHWKTHAMAEPWFTFPEEIDFDHLPELIASLADVALALGRDAETCRRNLWAAVRHGEERRKDGFHEELIFREYDLLRRALWRYIRDTQGVNQPATNVILAVDTAISVAASASLRGFHRDAFLAGGRWPAVVEELLERWPVSTDGGPEGRARGEANAGAAAVVPVEVDEATTDA